MFSLVKFRMNEPCSSYETLRLGILNLEICDFKNFNNLLDKFYL